MSANPKPREPKLDPKQQGPKQLDPKPRLKPDPLDAAADQVIAACDGDVRAAVRALIVAQGLLEAELRDVYAATSTGFARGRVKRGEQGS
jgi:hypothetical protein